MVPEQISLAKMNNVDIALGLPEVQETFMVQMVFLMNIR